MKLFMLFAACAALAACESNPPQPEPTSTATGDGGVIDNGGDQSPQLPQPEQ